MDTLFPRIRVCSLFSQLFFGLLLTSLIFFLGYQSVYYDAMEKIGYHKRDLMVSDVEKARDAQQAAKEQFKSALERFTTVLNIKGGKL